MAAITIQARVRGHLARVKTHRMRGEKAVSFGKRGGGGGCCLLLLFFWLPFTFFYSVLPPLTHHPSSPPSHSHSLQKAKKAIDRTQAVTKIQAYTRGYLALKKYRSMKKSHHNSKHTAISQSPPPQPPSHAHAPLLQHAPQSHTASTTNVNHSTPAITTPAPIVADEPPTIAVPPPSLPRVPSVNISERILAGRVARHSLVRREQRRVACVRDYIRVREERYLWGGCMRLFVCVCACVRV